MNTTENKLKELIRAYFKMPEHVERLRNLANLDLYFGPLNDSQLDDEWERQHYKGFSEALGTIQEWIDANVTDLWVDVDCDCVMTSEPEGYEDEGEWVEPYLETTYHVDMRTVKKYLLGKELGGYV